MRAFEVPVFELKGYEADDILGTLCRQAEEERIETLVLTGDTDTLQLVSPWVRVLMTYSVQKKAVYDEAAVRERFEGLGAEAVPDIKALEGDTSDNIPGVPGIGKKTAIKLLRQFASVEGILEHLDEVSPPRARKSLQDNVDSALQSKMLATIVRDAPVRLDLEEARFLTYDRPKVIEVLRDLEFFSLVSRIPDPEGDDATATQAELPIATEQRVRYTVVDTDEALAGLVRELSSPKGFSFTHRDHGSKPHVDRPRWTVLFQRYRRVLVRPNGTRGRKAAPASKGAGRGWPSSVERVHPKERPQRQLRHDGAGQ